ncbi:MAG: hypothetical protein ABFS12_18145 [Bacteroidota bacterium]
MKLVQINTYFRYILFIAIIFVSACENSKSNDNISKGISDTHISNLPAKGPYFPVDERIIEDRWKVERFVVELKKHEGNPVIVKDKEIEGIGPLAGGSILYDKRDDLYKIWYNVFDEKAYKNKTPFSYNMCYAESKDGIDWQKPNLEVFDNRGTISPKNNAIKLGKEKTGGLDIEINPKAKDISEYYVAIHNDSGGVFVSYSKYGKEFDCSFDKPAVWYHSDTHNNFVYDEINDRWLMYVRPRAFAGNGLPGVGRRRVAVKESKDLVNWTNEQTILVPEEGDPDCFYGMTVFRLGDLFFGQIQLYETVTHHLNQELAWSSDGFNWHRLPQKSQKLLLDVDKNNDWDKGMVTLFDKPVIANDEMRFYYGGRDEAHDAFGTNGIGMATTKLNRLVGVRDIPGESGRLLTRPIKVSGDLFVNANIKGELRVELRSAKRDEAIKGFTADDCTPITGDYLNAEVKWGDKKLSDLKGEIVRVRFQLKDGVEIYSFDVK